MPKKTDQNQQLIVDHLREMGATVHCTHMVGDGFPDLAVGYMGKNFFLEVKNPAQRPSLQRLNENEFLIKAEGSYAFGAGKI